MLFEKIRFIVVFYLRVILGVALIMLGIAGLFLPILQGVLLIVLGVTVLGWKPLKVWLRKLKVLLCAWWKRYRSGPPSE